MSNILKGILNESNPFYGHSDPDKEYGAPATSYRKSSRYPQDDTFDDDVAYSKKMYQLGQQQKAAKEKAQRDSDHDRLATGTNEGVVDNNIRMGMNDYYELADAIQEKLRTAIRLGDKERIQQLSKERDELDARITKYGLLPESEQLDELSNEKLAQYKTAAALDAGKADKEGDYKRGDKRFSGIVKATKKQFANDTKKSGISQGINEFAPGATGPKGPKDYGQPNSSRYIGGNKFVVGTTNNYVLTATIDKWGLEWDEDDEIWFLDSPGAAHIADASEGEIELPPPREQRNQIHDLVTDYLNSRNSADLQKVAAYYGHSDDGEMATNEGYEAPRFNSKQEVINHFVKNGKSAAAGSAAWERGWRGSSPKKPISIKNPPQRSYHDDLDDRRYSNTFENLGDQLKSHSLEALQQIKQQIEQKRAEDLAQWEQDFKNNVANKMRSQPIRPPEATPVAQPGEKHAVLKARLVQLNNAIQKQEILDKLVDRLERKGLMTPAMQNDTDTRMHVKYGAKDNYQSLNKKLDNAIQMLQNRLSIRKISGLKEGHDERDEYDNPRMGRDYGKGNLFVDPGSTEFPKEKHPSDPDVERGRPKNLKGVSKSLPADAFGRTTGKIPNSAKPTSKEDPFKDINENLDENLHKWFQEKWVRFGPDGKIRGDCARGDDSEGKPKCLPQSKAHSLGKKGRASAASRKRREDPNPERSGKAINVNTKKKSNESVVLGRDEGNFVGDTPVNLGGVVVKNLGIGDIVSYFGQKAKIVAMSKTGNTSRITIPSGMGGVTKDVLTKDLKRTSLSEEELDEACWSGYHRVAGTKAGFPGSCAKNKTNESEHSESCPHCGGEMVSEELMNEKKDACYYKVKSRYKVWPSAYASGALVKCRKKGADSWGNGGKSNESVAEATGTTMDASQALQKLKQIAEMRSKFTYYGLQEAGHADIVLNAIKACSAFIDHFRNNKQLDYVQTLKKLQTEIIAFKNADAFTTLGQLLQGTLGKINFQQGVAEDQLDEKWTKKYKDSINCSNPKGFSQKAHCAGKQKNESAILKGLK